MEIPKFILRADGTGMYKYVITVFGVDRIFNNGPDAMAYKRAVEGELKRLRTTLLGSDDEA